MAITFPTVAGDSKGTLAGNLVINKPTGTAQGDLLVCYIICSANTVITPVESGWTTDVTAAGIRGYTRIAGASEPSTYSFTRASDIGNNIGGQIVRVAGAHNTAPVETLGAQAGGNGTTVVLPTITVTNGFTLLQIAEHLVNSTYTPPSGPTEVFDAQYGAIAFTAAVGIETVGAGATGTRTWTSGTTGTRSGVMYALKDPPTGAASLAVTATLTAAAVVGAFGGASLAETATLTADASVDSTVQSSLVETATLNADAVVGTNADTSLPVTATLTADGAVGFGAAAALPVTVTLSATGVVNTFADASLPITATLTADGVAFQNFNIDTALPATATGTATAVAGVGAAASLPIFATNTALGQVGTYAASSLPVTATLASSATAGVGAASALPVTATLTATALAFSEFDAPADGRATISSAGIDASIRSTNAKAVIS